MAREHKSRYILTAEDRAKMAFDSVTRRFQALDSTAGKLGLTLGGVFSVAGLLAFTRTLQNYEREQNRLTATINAQGHAAGFTRGQLDDMADALERSTGLGGGQVTSAQAELLKFGNIYNDVFERALELSADLAQFQGTDLLSATSTVAKALQNPLEGMRQLERVMGRLSPAQREVVKAMVEQGRVVEAQNLLLDQLQGKIGGTADLMNTEYTGAINGTTEAFNSLIEALGQTDTVKASVTGFFGFLTQSMRDLKAIIENGDWFGGLTFLLGGRGQSDLSSRSKMALDIQNLERNLRDQQQKADNSSDPVHSSNAAALANKLARMEAEYNRLYGAGAAIPAPQARIEQAPESVRLPKSPKASGAFTDAEAQRDRRQRLARALREEDAARLQQLGIDARREEARRIIAATEAANDYLIGIRGETDALVANNRQRQFMLDSFYLEHIGLKAGTAEWQLYLDQIVAVRDQQERLNQSWTHGARVALTNYLDQVRSVSSASEQMFTRAIKGMEDALVEMTLTGKLSFRDMAQSILADIARIAVQQQITGPLAAGIGGMFGAVGAQAGPAVGPSYLGGYATGTDYVPRDGLAYLHKGEAVVPAAQNKAGGGGGGPTVYIDARNSDAAGYARLEKMIVNLGGSIERRAVSAVQQAKVRGAMA